MKSLLSKRIPTLFGIVLIVIGVIVTSYMVRTGGKFAGVAAPSENPRDVRITNITDSSFTVTYTTDASVTGSVSLGQDKTNSQIILDDRDQSSGVPKPYSVHSITVNNLKPSINYPFSINSGTTTFLNSNQPFQATTGPTLNVPGQTGGPTGPTLSGTILLSNPTQDPNALVYVTTNNGQTISTLTNNNGIYSINLSTLRISNLSAFVQFTLTSQIQLLVTDSSKTSHINISITQLPSVPTVTLSNDYDFTATTQPLSTPIATSSSFPTFSLDNSIVATPKITTPTKDESFTDQQPLFTGRALPNETVTVTIHSQNVQGQVKADTSGFWSFRPTTPLEPGQHTITIVTKNASGILQTITQSFTVFAEGNQVPGAQNISPTPTSNPTSPTLAPTKIPTLTPIQSGPTTKPTSAPTSATATPTIIPTVKPTATPTIKPTATPTPVIIAQATTPTPTLIPSVISATPTPASPTTAPAQISPTLTQSGPTPAIAATGNDMPLNLGVIVGIATLGIGIILLLLSRAL